MPSLSIAVGASVVINALSHYGATSIHPAYSRQGAWSEEFYPQDCAPIVRLHTGRLSLEAVKWRYHFGGRDVPALPAGRHYARRCLVPATWLALHTDSHSEELGFGQANGGWFMSAGLWQPASSYGDFPYGFALLTAADKGETRIRRPILIPPAYWRDYLNPQKDIRWLFASDENKESLVLSYAAPRCSSIGQNIIGRC